MQNKKMQSVPLPPGIERIPKYNWQYKTTYKYLITFHIYDHIMISSHKRAFDKTSRGFLKYEEIIAGLAAMEPVTPHGDSCGEIRSVYILRYYDSGGDGLLSFDDF